MLRLQLSCALLGLALAACTPCARVANADDSANDKAKACGLSVSNWTDSQVQACEQNLSNCSDNDKKALDQYADCLNGLPTCAASISWTVSRISCAQALAGVSVSCLKGLK
jgi:hypothetical protein